MKKFNLSGRRQFKKEPLIANRNCYMQAKFDWLDMLDRVLNSLLECCFIKILKTFLKNIKKTTFKVPGTHDHFFFHFVFII